VNKLKYVINEVMNINKDHNRLKSQKRSKTKTNRFVKRKGHYMRLITVYIFNIHVYTCIYELSHICWIL